MIEFIVALVAVVALAAGLLQIASLGRAHTEAMVDARREAAARALSPMSYLSDASYIEDWNEGPDGSRYTTDDEMAEDEGLSFQNIVVDRASPDDEGWTVYNGVPQNPFSSLRGAGNPSSVFGLTMGEADETVSLLPAVQHLLYGADSLNVRCEVWLTRMEDIY